MMTYKETLKHFLIANKKMLRDLFILFAIGMVLVCNWESHVLYHKYVECLIIYICVATSVPVGAWIDYKLQ